MSSPLHIWITGAGRGIGAAIAIELGRKHHITLSGRNEAALLQVQSMLAGGKGAAIPCDVASESSVRLAHTAAVELFGPVDVLINNAGIGVFQNLAEMSIADFDDQIAVNLRGTFLCTRSVLESMIARKQGLIATINSVAALTAFAGCTAYAASKAGALALNRSLRCEVREHNVKVTDLIVGATDTEIWSESERETFSDRMMQASDVASAVAMLVEGFHNPRTHFEEIIIRPQNGDL